MSSQSKRVPIWYFIGLLLLVYGILICGAGIYELYVPPEHPSAMAYLHPAIWWGGLLVLLGAFYTYHFAPSRSK